MKRILFILVAFLLGGSGRLAAETGKAVIRGIPETVPVSGTVSFEEHPDGLDITVRVTGLVPGKHGIHIHELLCGRKVW